MCVSLPFQKVAIYFFKVIQKVVINFKFFLFHVCKHCPHIPSVKQIDKKEERKTQIRQNRVKLTTKKQT